MKVTEVLVHSSLRRSTETLHSGIQDWSSVHTQLYKLFTHSPSRKSVTVVILLSKNSLVYGITYFESSKPEV